MKKLAFLLCLLAFPAWAQTPTQIVPGYQTTGGCKGFSPCWASTSSPINSASAEGSHIFKTTSGNLFGFSVTTGATAGYVLVFNSATVPADGAVTPVACYVAPASNTLGVAFTPVPLTLSNGIVLVFSTSGCFTKTISATSFFLAEIQ
jgi:hypothetical protein